MQNSSHPEINLEAHTSAPTVTRNSNIELLRFIMMVAILIWHTFVHGFNFKETGIDPSVEISFKKLLILCICVPAVNSFMLISGHYGIKLSKAKILKLWLLCLIIMIVSCYFTKTNHIFTVLFPISSNCWWFMKCYLIIMLISPIINEGIAHLNKMRLIKILLMLLFINSIVKFGNFQYGGYDIFSLFIIYLIGRYLQYFKNPISMKIAICTYIIATMLLYALLLFFYIYGNKINIWLFLSYNNPLIILQSIGIVYVVLNIRKFKSKIADFLGKNCLAIYLITEIIGLRLYRFLANIYNNSIFQFILLCLNSAAL